MSGGLRFAPASPIFDGPLPIHLSGGVSTPGHQIPSTKQKEVTGICHL